MKFSRAVPLGFVADGRRRHLQSEEFRARKQAVRTEIDVAFAPRLAGADGLGERLRVQWQKSCALSRALREIHPASESCF